jgi:hypothetical protein
MTTRTQYPYSSTYFPRKSNQELITYQRQWNTYENVENFNQSIYNDYVNGIVSRSYYTFNGTQELQDYNAGLLLHRQALPTITFTPIGTLPIPPAAQAKFSGVPTFNLRQCGPIPSNRVQLTNAELNEQAKQLTNYTYISTYNFKYPNEPYQFKTLEEMLSYKKIANSLC